MRSAEAGGLRGGILSRLDLGDAGRILVRDSLLPVMWRRGVVNTPPSEVEDISYCLKLKSCIKPKLFNSMNIYGYMYMYTRFAFRIYEMQNKSIRTLVKAWILPIDFVFLPLTFRLRRVLLLVGDSVPTLSVMDQSRPPKTRIASAVVGCSKPSIDCSK